jgi:hypothetical protein
MTTCLISHLSPATTPTYAHYNTLHHAQALAIDRDTATLIVAVSSRQAATQANNYFPTAVRRAIATTNAAIHGVPIAAADFMPLPSQP